MRVRVWRVNDRKHGFFIRSSSFLGFSRRGYLRSSHSRKRINAVGIGPFMEAGFMSRRRYTGAGIYPCADCTRCLHTFGSSPASRRTYIRVFVAWFRGKSTVGKKKRRPRPRRSEGRNLKLSVGFRLSYRTVDPTAHEIELPGPINRRCLWNGGIAASAWFIDPRSIIALVTCEISSSLIVEMLEASIFCKVFFFCLKFKHLVISDKFARF